MSVPTPGDETRDDDPGLAPLAQIMEARTANQFEFETSQVIQSILYDHRYGGGGVCDCRAAWPCSAYEHAERLLVTWIKERLA